MIALRDYVIAAAMPFWPPPAVALQIGDTMLHDFLSATPSPKRACLTRICSAAATASNRRLHSLTAMPTASRPSSRGLIFWS